MVTQEEIYIEIKKLYSINKAKKPKENWPHDITKALKCLNNNLFKLSFTVAEMRRKCNISQKNFSSRFKLYVGHTPVSYIKYHRIECSKQLLLMHESEINLSFIQIAFEVGYEFPSTFNNAFKDILGLPPKRYWIKRKKK